MSQKHCVTCGAPLRVEALFCGVCGARQPQSEPDESGLQPEQAVSSGTSVSAPATPARSRKNLLLVVAVACVLVVAAMGAAIFFLRPEQTKTYLLTSVEADPGIDGYIQFFLSDEGGFIPSYELYTSQETYVYFPAFYPEYESSYTAYYLEPGDQQTFSYNASGNLLSSVSTEAEGSSSTTSYEYDDEGNAISRTITGQDGSTSKVSYTYDDAGRVLTESYNNSSGSSYMNTYTYDDAGNCVLWQYESSSYSSSTSYTWDTEGRMLSQSYSSGSGDGPTYEYAYDSYGNLSEYAYHYSQEGSEEYSIAYTYRYTYDSSGKILSAEITSSEGETCSYSFSYDSAGRLIGKSSQEYDISATYRYEYDEADRVVRMEYACSYDGDASAWDYGYHIEHSYTQDGELAAYTYTDDDGYTYTYELGYDEVGMLSGITYSYSTEGSSSVSCSASLAFVELSELQR